MKYLITFLLLSLFIAPLDVYAEQSGPIQTIKNIQHALDTGDVTLFDASIDMESLLGQCVDVLIADSNIEGQQTIPPVLALILSTANLNDDARNALRSAIIAEVGAFIRYGVSSGAYAGKKIKSPPPDGILASFLSQSSMGRKEIVRIGQVTKENDAIYVNFVVKDYGNDRYYPVEAWLRQDSEQWKVIGLRNIRTLIRMVQSETEQAL